MFVCCDCCVLSGRGLCDELITRSEESYRLWCVVVWSKNLVKMRSHTQSVVIEPNTTRITGSISYKPLISDISVLIVCNKTGGTIKGDIKIVTNTISSMMVFNHSLLNMFSIGWYQAGANSYTPQKLIKISHGHSSHAVCWNINYYFYLSVCLYKVCVRGIKRCTSHMFSRISRPHSPCSHDAFSTCNYVCGKNNPSEMSRTTGH